MSAPRASAGGWFGRVRFSAVELLIALILLIAFTPFIESLRAGDVIEAFLITVVLVSAAFAVGGDRYVLGIAAILLVPTLVCKWLNHLYPDQMPPHLFLGFGLALVAFAVLNLLGFVLRAVHVNAEVLCAALSAYLMLGLLWSFAYILVGRIDPDAFSYANPLDSGTRMDGFNAFYFSFVTLSTVGFGDIAPVSRVARTLAVMEAITGMFYMAVLIARLVAMYSPARIEPTENFRSS